MSNQNVPVDVAAAFAQVFQPKNPFPRWFQPNPNIGQILVHSQEEEDELKARDWSPKPLPGSEVSKTEVKSIEDVSAALATLQAERDLFEAQKVAFMTRVEARVEAAEAAPGAPAAAAAAPPSGSATDVAAQVAGALSDTSEEPAPSAPKAATKK